MVLAATLAVGAAAGATPEDDVRRIVDEERERGGTPAMCVVVVRDGTGRKDPGIAGQPKEALNHG